jgi:hypothetical protein
MNGENSPQKTRIFFLTLFKSSSAKTRIWIRIKLIWIRNRWFV